MGDLVGLALWAAEQIVIVIIVARICIAIIDRVRQRLVLARIGQNLRVDRSSGAW